MRFRSLPCAILMLCMTASMAPVKAQELMPDAATVMILGVFHFGNPGRDLVKSNVIDVMASGNQVYLAGLATRLAAFRPTDVLVECEPSTQPQQDAAFAAYVGGASPLTVNEVQQIGFRVAKEAGIAGVTCFDEGNIGWNSAPMFDYIGAHEPATKVALDAMYASLSAREARDHATLSLPELLKLTNDPARDRENKDLYIRTNAIDAGNSFAGADASASWWHRNFRMYANVQKAAGPGRRVLVIAGAGHTAILKDLLAIDAEREAEDVRSYLAP